MEQIFPSAEPRYSLGEDPVPKQ